MRGSVVVLSVVIGLSILLSACGTVQPAATTGTLSVTVNGLPGGVPGAVTVTGPSGYSKLVTKTTSLTVDAGTYNLSVAQVAGTGSIVPVVYDGTASKASVAVKVSATASTTVTYAGRPGSGALWVPIAQTTGATTTYPIAYGYLDGTLAAATSSPDTTLMDSTNVYHEGMAFDGKGNVWVSDQNGYIKEYAVADLASSTTPTPAVTINGSVYGQAFALAFDASGDLWATFPTANEVVMYSAGQLPSGAPTGPDVILDSNATSSIVAPAGLAFDATGGLWVANNNASTSTIVHFTPAELAASGTPDPDITIATDGTSLGRPFGLAFDASGNLWVTDHGNGNIMRYDASQLTGTGTITPTPSATIDTVPTRYGAGKTPTGIAFDHNGDLWVTVPGASTLARFSSVSTLTGTVSPAPDIEITTDVLDAGLLAFDPPPSGLNIHTP